MKKRVYPYMAALMLAMAENPYYSYGTPTRFMSERQRKFLDEEKRAKAHRLFPVNISEHEFTIHGEKIMARDRKTALKIYANRHHKRPNSK